MNEGRRCSHIYMYVCVCVYIYIHTYTQKYIQYYSFTTMWVNLEIILRGEINKTEIKILCDITYIWNLKNKAVVNITKEKQTHRYREQTSG